MPVLTGKTGADAIFIALRHICRVITKYNARLNNVITAAQGAGAITAGQAATITAFLGTASGLCAAFDALATYSGF